MDQNLKGGTSVTMQSKEPYQPEEGEIVSQSVLADLNEPAVSPTKEQSKKVVRKH
jgi:hypothetical protein